MNKEVNLTKRVMTPEWLRYYPVVWSNNGRVEPDYVLVDGKSEFHKEGAYYVSWYEGKRLCRKSVGKDAAVAGARRQQKELSLASRVENPRVMLDC